MRGSIGAFSTAGLFMTDAMTAAGGDKIVEHLKREGVDIARRTVAKYREALRIPSSVQRRREKQMAARLGSSS